MLLGLVHEESLPVGSLLLLLQGELDDPVPDGELGLVHVDLLEEVECDGVLALVRAADAAEDQSSLFQLDLGLFAVLQAKGQEDQLGSLGPGHQRRRGSIPAINDPLCS